ncbi:MAG: TonB-dependent siderophore receptor, partial [Hydrococcus sp. RU_2_2]|nr:TonB-dependent siderophore receptor [Hydrococcus sp. RU_2_2]
IGLPPTPLARGVTGEPEGGQTVTIERVQLNPTETGFEILLLTPTGTAQQLRVVNISQGNNFIAEIPNAQINLFDGQPFRAENPIEGVSEVTVTNQDENTVLVTVVGEEEQPTVELFDSEKGLIFSATPLPEGGQTAQEENIELVVTGEQDGYRVPNTSTATRTDTPLRDIPQSIQIIPQEVLQEQGGDLTSALLNAPSVRNSAPTNFDSLRVQVRGFSTPVTVNGLEDSLNSSTIGSDLTGIERIEILGGPNSVLLGSSAPGGTVNFVTKQPLRDPYYFAEITAGSFNLYRGEVDLSGPLEPSKRVLYRLNTSYRDQEFFNDLSSTRSFVIAPVVSFAFAENIKLTLEGRYANVKFNSIPLGLPAIGTILPNPNGEIPREFNPNEGTYLATSTRLGYALDVKLSENWSLRNGFQFTRYSGGYSGENAGTFLIGLLPDNRTLERVTFNEASNQNDFRLSTNVVGQFATGKVQHQLLLGVDLGRVSGKFSGKDRETTTIDVFDPVYGGRTFGEVTSEYSTENVTDELGFLVQDRITITNNLKLLVGGRFDLFRQTNKDLLADTETHQSGSAFSPRLGIVYQPIPPISLYANYSRSFEPAIGRAFDGSTFEPTRGTQFEIGVKADLNDRLSATLALYDITQSNVLTDDPDNLGFSIQTGEQRSQGIELNLAGEILPGWNIFAGYAYNDARVTEDNSIPVGNRLEQTAPHAASLWTTYEIQQGSLRGLGFGLGLFYVGDRAGDSDNTFEVPSYLRTDATIFYKRDGFRAAININNLFDVDYFESGFNRDRVFPGAPLTVQGTISWEF